MKIHLHLTILKQVMYNKIRLLIYYSIQLYNFVLEIKYLLAHKTSASYQLSILIFVEHLKLTTIFSKKLKA